MSDQEKTCTKPPFEKLGAEDWHSISVEAQRAVIAWLSSIDINYRTVVLWESFGARVRIYRYRRLEEGMERYAQDFEVSP